jgi:Sulfotransferase family
MIISHSKQFIFIHIYKNAGTSITELLWPHARLRERMEHNAKARRIIKFVNHIGEISGNKWLDGHGNKWLNGVHKHATATEIRSYLGDKLFFGHFTFAFVRNPFDWQVSLYHYIKSSEWHPDFQVVRNLSFREFVLREIEKRAPTQSSFVTDQGSIIVDFVGKVENIQNDLAAVCERIGLTTNSIPHLNRSVRESDYMNYYDEDLRALLISYYNEDFTNFGY